MRGTPSAPRRDRRPTRVPVVPGSNPGGPTTLKTPENPSTGTEPLTIPNFVREEIAKKIAGEIAIAENPGSVMKNWREYFGASIREIARIMNISPGVVSDYEKGKRTPGSKFIKRYVEALLKYDERHGWRGLSKLAENIWGVGIKALDIYEYKRPVRFEEIVTAAQGYVVNSLFEPENTLKGFLMFDSLTIIEEFNPQDFMMMMTLAQNKVLVFTGVTTGKPSMVALRISYIKPSMVLLHRPVKLDRLAVRLSEKEGIPLVVSLSPTVAELKRRLRSIA